MEEIKLKDTEVVEKTKVEKKEEQKFDIAVAVNCFNLTSRKKFVCLRMFGKTELHTIEDWEKLLKEKEII